MAAALKYARRLSKPKFIVVLLPDTGRNYLTKIFSDSWMQENGFWEGKKPVTIVVKDILAEKKLIPLLISVAPRDTLSRTI